MSLMSELRRRSVIKVGVAYFIFSWLVLQISDILLPAFGVPEWGIRLVIALLAVGFLAALIVSWVYDLTPDGLVRSSDTDQSHLIAPKSGRRLEVATIVMAIIAIALIAANRLTGDAAPDGVRADGTIPIVAVLPFKATGSDDGGFLAAGLHDDLLTRLAKLDAFKVISRTSMMEYEATTKNMRQIGDELGAGFILEGGVQAHGDQVRINAQLINASLDEHVWADTYTRKLEATSLFAVQGELASSIANEMRSALSESDRALLNEVPTQSIDAYKAYLRALDLLDRQSFDAANSHAIVVALEEAVELDPRFALAWAQLSSARSRLAQVTGDETILPDAVVALDKAKELQPLLPEAQLAHAVYLYRGENRYQDALNVLEDLLARTKPTAEVTSLQSYLYRRVGRFEDAYDAALVAFELEPRSVRVYHAVTTAALMIDDCDAIGEYVASEVLANNQSGDSTTRLAEYELVCNGDAERANEILAGRLYETPWHYGTAAFSAKAARDYERYLELTEVGAMPFAPYRAHLDRVDALRMLGRDLQAESLLDKVGREILAAEGDLPGGFYALARSYYHALRGDQDETLRWLDVKNERLRIDLNDDEYFLATARIHDVLVRATAGLNDEAIAELSALLEEQTGWSFRSIDLLPVMDGLRHYPAYEALKLRYSDSP